VISFAPSARIRSSFAFDRYDSTRHAGFPGRVSDALAGIARADRPDAPFSFFVGQHRDCVCRAAQFIGVDRLEIFQLQPDIWKTRTELEPQQWRAHDRTRDSLSRFANRGQFNWAD
jgi:hypothetical protein